VSSSPTRAGSIDVTMPQMGVSVAEGTVVRWCLAVGDPVQAEQTVCEITTDKIDTEVPSPASGTLAEIVVDVDQTVEVGAVLARIATDGGASGATPQAGPALEQEVPGMPDPGGSPAPVPGTTAAAGGSANGQAHGRAPGQRLSPVVARMAAEYGLDLTGMVGTGRGGRIRKQDVLALIDQGAVGSAPAEPAGEFASADSPEPPLHIESPYRPDPEPPAHPAPEAPPGAPPAPVVSRGAPPAAPGGTLSRMRRQIGEHMKRSLETAATCTTWIEVDMSRVEAARTRLGVTALPIVARAVIGALREHPALNATLEGEAYARHEQVNLGIAVSMGEEGLIVPVIHHAEQLSVEGLAARVRDLARRARGRRLAHDEVQGATFTITNPGQFGSIMATPIINQPQVAILDLEAVVKRAVVLTDELGGDSIAIRPMVILGLSWDHRALDGAQAAQFLAAVKRRLEDWREE
jgi:pyruvate/2-oxoglutarate dehydrogenase complex dihydrolipoamide acyltransferase (E2) component